MRGARRARRGPNVRGQVRGRNDAPVSNRRRDQRHLQRRGGDLALPKTGLTEQRGEELLVWVGQPACLDRQIKRYRLLEAEPIGILMESRDARIDPAHLPGIWALRRVAQVERPGYAQAERGEGKRAVAGPGVSLVEVHDR